MMIARIAGILVPILLTTIVIGDASAQPVRPQGKPAAANQPLWRCDDPATPFRFEHDAKKKDDPPKCSRWVELRGSDLASILSALGSTKFAAANSFLAAAGRVTGAAYPTTADGAPQRTVEVLQDAKNRGDTVKDIAAIPTGSLIVLNGLGGVVVEARTSPDSAWQKKILYPSAALGGTLNTIDPQRLRQGAMAAIIKP